MSNIAKLKKKAAELERKKHYEKALELYQQVLESSRATEEERDVPLYNRIGDLYFRIGNTDEAIGYYEKAVDLYAEGGLFNNAIALCNKILRYAPSRSSAYYKLGLISAKKGFNSDAKQNFLEYADRMQKGGKLDEAFRALKEFADLCPGQDDVRLMLADQLVKADRKPEALEQLQLLYDTLEADGRATEAAATVERMQALDPGFTPKKTAIPRQQKKEGVVFLDLDYLGDVPAAKTAIAQPNASKSAEAPGPTDRGAGQLEGLELTALGSKGQAEGARTPAHRPSLELVGMRPAVEPKPGVARSVDDADFDSHYDLGIAFRQMGLMDEAIAAFQKATRSSSHRFRASESLGECFIERGQPAVAATILERVVEESGGTEDALVGVLYLLGRSAEELDKPGEALAFYQRVIAVDMGFRDAARRLSSLAEARR